MEIQTHLQIGDFHTNFCEDFLIHEQISSTQKLIAVMDGCTMGDESTFSSMLLGKVLRKVSKERFYDEFISKTRFNNEELLRLTLKSSFTEIINVKNQLTLDKSELLSTLIVGIVDEKTYNASFLVIGDGLVVLNGITYDFDQKDMPDYFGYHLHENFDAWFQKQNQRATIENLKDISICTDGIFSFKNYSDKKSQMNHDELIKNLLIDDNGFDKPNFFRIKIDDLKTEQGFHLTDDIAIIRMIKNEA